MTGQDAGAKRLELLRAMLLETERQSALLDSGDVDGLAASLAARKAVMDAVDALGSPSGFLPDEEELLKRIAQVDSRNLEKAAAMHREMADGMRQAGAERSLSAYQQPPGKGSMFVDREG